MNETIKINMQLLPPPPHFLIRKIREPHLAPRIMDCLRANLLLGGKDPLNNVAASCFLDRRIRVLSHQPVVVLALYLRLERLVVAHVDGLNKAGAAGGDELYLHPKRLDLLDNAAHHVDAEGVKEEEGDDADGGRRNVGRKDIVNPLEHDFLHEPRLWLTLVDSVSRIGREFAALNRRPLLTCATQRREDKEKKVGNVFPLG
jgi:hypothetical protein